MDRHQDDDSAPLGDADSQASGSPARSRKPLYKRAFRKVYKSITAPEKDAEGQRLSLAKSISRRLSREGSGGASSASLLQRSLPSGSSDEAHTAPFPSVTGAYSATPPKSTPVALARAPSGPGGIRRASLQLSSAREEAESRGYMPTVPVEIPDNVVPVPELPNESHEVADSAEPAVAQPNAFATPFSGAPAGDSQLLPDTSDPKTTAEPVPHAPESQTTAEPASDAADSQTTAEPAPDAPDKTSQPEPQAEQSPSTQQPADSISTAENTPATGTPPGSERSPSTPYSATGQGTTPDTDQADGKAAQDAVAPASRRHVFTSPSTPSADGPATAGSAPGDFPSPRALPPPGMFASSPPAAAALAETSPEVAAATAAALTATAAAPDDGAPAAAAPARKHKAKRGPLRGMACSASAVTVAASVAIAAHLLMRK
eukprot:jgi/Ulvmu1/6548/UM003_0182.1